MPLGNGDAGIAECLMHELAAPRAGELKTILATFLETIIGAVRAAAGVVQLVSPDGHTLQIICSAGLSAELQKEAESFVGLDCKHSNIEGTLDRVTCAAYVGTCATQQDCQPERSSGGHKSSAASRF